MGSCIDSKSISCCLVESCVYLGAALGLFLESCVDLKIAFALLKESDSVERIISETLLGFHFEVKIQFLSSFFS